MNKNIITLLIVIIALVIIGGVWFYQQNRLPMDPIIQDPIVLPDGDPIMPDNMLPIGEIVPPIIEMPLAPPIMEVPLAP